MSSRPRGFAGIRDSHPAAPGRANQGLPPRTAECASAPYPDRGVAIFHDGAPGDRPTDLDPKHRSSRRTVGSPCDNQLVNQSSSLLPAAHLCLCAAAILLRAAGLMVRLRLWLRDAACVPPPEPSRRRMSAIFSSTFRLICSNPVNAASSSDASVNGRLCPLGMKCVCTPFSVPRMIGGHLLNRCCHL